MLDRFATRHTATTPPALDAFGAAVFEIAAHRPGAGVFLKQALAADPHMIAAHAVMGFANLILARAELLPVARQALAAAESARAAKDGAATPDEICLLEALHHACEDRFGLAADRLEERIHDSPDGFLLVKLAHALRFMIGQTPAMLRLTEGLTARASRETPGYGFLLGCHAFGLEEAGRFDEAERTGLNALHHQPDDAWAQHAVAHVYDMRGETAVGISWLNRQRPRWQKCNNFAFHMAWHLALLHLDAGDSDAALDLYDTAIRPEQTDDFRDMANAISLLWRMHQLGSPVGRRWQDLLEIALRRRQDTTLVFASLHTLLALIASGERTAAQELLSALEVKATRTGDQAAVAASIGVPLARTLLRHPARGEATRLTLLAKDLPSLGGSAAQRDVFLRSLITLTVEAGDGATAGRLLTLRGALKALDFFASLALAAIAQPPRFRLPKLV